MLESARVQQTCNTSSSVGRFRVPVTLSFVRSVLVYGHTVDVAELGACRDRRVARSLHLGVAAGRIDRCTARKRWGNAVWTPR
jgi:hypothetical protein